MLRIVTHVTPLLTLQLLTPYCDICIQDRCKISFHLCDTQLVEGEISMPMLPLHDFENMVKMFTFPLLTLPKTTRGPFKCYVTQMGVGGCLIFWGKALRWCNVQCY